MQDIETAVFSPISSSKTEGIPAGRTDLGMALKKARNHIALPGEAKNPLAEWTEVKQRALSLLGDDEKSFYLLSVFFEAECVLDRLSFPGDLPEDTSVFSAGFDLLSRFTDMFWDDMSPNEGDDEAYIAVRSDALGRLDKVLPPLLMQAPLWREEGAPVSCYELDMAAGINTLRTQKPDDFALALAGESFDSAGELSEADTNVLTALRKQSDHAIQLAYARAAHDLEAFYRMQSVLKDVFHTDRPSFGKIEAAMEKRKRAAYGIAEAKKIPLLSPEIPEQTDPDSAETPSVTSAPATAPGVINSRASAYAALSDAARYLRQAEPHSPVPFLVEKAVQWGGMSFETLLAEWIRDDGQCGQVREYLGIPARTPSE